MEAELAHMAVPVLKVVTCQP